MFIAARHISVTRDDKLVALMPGDACPEAADFPHDVLMRCIKVGQLVNVDSAPDKAPVMIAHQAERKIVDDVAAIKASKPRSTSEANGRVLAKSKSAGAEQREAAEVKKLAPEVAPKKRTAQTRRAH